MSGDSDIVTPDGPTRRSLFVALVILLASAITSAAANLFLIVRFPDLPTPPDLLLQTLPYIRFAEYLTEPAIAASIVLLFVYAIRNARHQIADMAAVFGIMYLLRSVLMILTPLASAHVGPGHFGLVPIDQNGMFPSGHAGAALLCFLLIDSERSPILKRVVLGLALAQWIVLLLAHGHYSIDIAGGMLLAYFVHHEWRSGSLFRPLKRLMASERPSAADDG